jgi:HK97 family phage major capsid protein
MTTFFRDATFGRADPAARTAPLTLSTETPVERYGLYEILDHSAGAVDLSRAPLPLLTSHDPNQLPIGRVENLQLSDGRLRGVARFSSSAHAQQIFQDVQDRIATGVSIGYEYTSKPERIDNQTFRVRFRPLEASVVSVPADIHAGFYRSKDLTTMETRLSRRARARADHEHTDLMLDAVPAEDQSAFAEALEVQELYRRNADDTVIVRQLDTGPATYEAFRRDSIQRFAEQWKSSADAAAIHTLMRSALDTGLSVKAFRQELLKMLTTTPTVTGRLEPQPPSYDTLPREITQRGPIKGFADTLEGRREAYSVGMFYKSIAGDAHAREWCQQNGIVPPHRRVLVEGIYSSGGVAVPDIVADSIIRNVENYGLCRSLARRWPMTSATATLPLRTAGVSSAFVGESDSVSPGDPTLSGVGLVAKELAVATRISRNLLDDSAPDLAAFLTQEFATEVAKKEDSCWLIGDGTSTYGGMFGVVNKLQDSAYAGGRYTAATNHDTFPEFDVSDISGMYGLLPESAKAGNGACIVCSSAFRDLVLTRLALAAGGSDSQSIQGGIVDSQGIGRFGGYRVYTSPLMPAGATTDYTGLIVALFGNFQRSTVFGDRRTFDLVVDISRYVLERQILFLVTSRFDVVNYDVGTSTAPGQCVGLYGA